MHKGQRKKNEHRQEKKKMSTKGNKLGLTCLDSPLPPSLVFFHFLQQACNLLLFAEAELRHTCTNYLLALLCFAILLQFDVADWLQGIDGYQLVLGLFNPRRPELG